MSLFLMEAIDNPNPYVPEATAPPAPLTPALTPATELDPTCAEFELALGALVLEGDVGGRGGLV